VGVSGGAKLEPPDARGDVVTRRLSTPPIPVTLQSPVHTGSALFHPATDRRPTGCPRRLAVCLDWKGYRAMERVQNLERARPLPDAHERRPSRPPSILTLRRVRAFRGRAGFGSFRAGGSPVVGPRPRASRRCQGAAGSSQFRAAPEPPPSVGGEDEAPRGLVGRRTDVKCDRPGLRLPPGWPRPGRRHEGVCDVGEIADRPLHDAPWSAPEMVGQSMVLPVVVT